VFLSLLADEGVHFRCGLQGGEVDAVGVVGVGGEVTAGEDFPVGASSAAPGAGAFVVRQGRVQVGGVHVQGADARVGVAGADPVEVLLFDAAFGECGVGGFPPRERGCAFEFAGEDAGGGAPPAGTDVPVNVRVTVRIPVQQHLPQQQGGFLGGVVAVEGFAQVAGDGAVVAAVQAREFGVECARRARRTGCLPLSHT